MKEGQNDIYYASGASPEIIRALPQVEAVLDKGYEVLFLTDSIDEFCMLALPMLEGKKFKSVQSADVDVATEDEKKALDEKTKDTKD